VSSGQLPEHLICGRMQTEIGTITYFRSLSARAECRGAHAGSRRSTGKLSVRKNRRYILGPPSLYLALPVLPADGEITHGDFLENTFATSLHKLQSYDCRLLESLAVVCPNPECKKLTLTAKLFSGYRSNGSVNKHTKLRELRLEPAVPSPLPDQVPEWIRAEYAEAYQIKDLSPKAAATMARRILQGMIRNFWDIKGRTLKAEIDALRDQDIDPATLKAIDSVRQIGNMAAHMEQDASLIVDVEPNEADALIWLIEELVNDWYVRRRDRASRMAELQEIAAKQARTQQRSS